METRRLLLRALTLSDATSLSTLMTPAVSRWLTNFPTPFPQQDAEARIQRILNAETRGHAFVRALTQHADTTLMGWFGLYLDSRTSHGVLGYWLGTPYHRQGYMREAAPFILHAAQTKLGIKTTEAFIHPTNTPSLALARSLGLHITGERSLHAPARNTHETCLHLSTQTPHVAR